MTPAQKVGAALSACALAVGVIAKHEGYVPVGYKDPAPAGYATICYGHRQDGVIGKRFTADQCAALLAQDALTHGLAIGGCLPEQLPTKTRAAFISVAFNLGVERFCKSSIAVKARAGDLPGACASLTLYTYAGGRQLPGLIARRKEERKLCEEGLHP